MPITEIKGKKRVLNKKDTITIQLPALLSRPPHLISLSSKHIGFPPSSEEMGAATPTPSLWQSIASLSKLTSCGQIPQLARDKVGIRNHMQMHRNGRVESASIFSRIHKSLSRVFKPPCHSFSSLKPYFAQRMGARPIHKVVDTQPKYVWIGSAVIEWESEDIRMEKT